MKIKLIELKKLHHLPTRVINVCETLKLNDLKDIIAYYKKYNTFENVSNIGKSGNYKLIELCDYYLDESFLSSSLNLLCFEEPLSTTEIEILVSYNADSLDLFILKSRNDYFKLPVPLKKWHIKYHYLKGTLGQLNTIDNIKNVNSDYAIFLLKKYSRSVSVRTYNILNQIIDNIKENPSSIYSYNTVKEIKKIKKCGAKTTNELLPIIQKTISKLDEKHLDVPKWQEKKRFIDFCDLCNDDEVEFENWLKDNSLSFKNEIPFFSLLKFHIDNKFSGRDFEILNFIFDSFDSSISRKNLAFRNKELALKYGVSRERIRQLKNSIITTFFNEAKNLIIACNKYKLRIPLYVENSDTEYAILSVEKISCAEGSFFPEEIIFKILQLMNKDYSLVIDHPKTNEYRYLVLNKILKIADIANVIQHIKSIISGTIKQDITLNLKGLIFSNLKGSVLPTEIANIIYREIIFLEFGLLTNVNDEIIIERTSKKKNYEYLIEILEIADRPLHIDDFIIELKNNYTIKIKSPESIRSQLINNTQFFVNTSLSTYGLKRWEEEGMIIGGTIIDVIIKFLHDEDTPRHIYTIAKYVKQHRDTNERSIEGLIKSDTLNRFINYSFGFYGLDEKQNINFSEKINRLPGPWFKQFKNQYFQQSTTSIFTIDTIIKQQAEKYKTVEEHIEVFINRRIDKNSLCLKGNKLHLIDED